ncbi:MFS-type transporter SLC18B1-like [Symsagittifera roscoffensis]|uniref:MFS-type transporter SLC18B1-like n=1 Tax=Symsagittifera roscoffensis TaxID=84072 RepID=UPI00307B8FF1
MAAEDISYSRKWVILIVGMGMNTVPGLNDYFMSPFLPNYHQKRGVSVTVNGIIFGLCPVGEVTSALLVFLFLLSIRNKKLLALSGMLLTGFSQILLGLLNFLFPTNNYAYIPLAMILRFAVGFGVGVNFTSGVPIFVELFPKMRGRVCSYLTAAMTVGGVMGPGLGSVLYSWGGYTLPFWVVGFYCVILAVIGLFIIPKPEPTTSKAETNDKFSARLAFNFMKDPGVCVIIFSSNLPIATMGFFMSALSPFLLEKYGISASRAGLFMIPLSLGRGIISPLYGYLVDKGFGVLTYQFVGVFVTTLGYSILYLLRFLDDSTFSLTILEILLFVISCSCAAIFATFIPTIIEVYQASVRNDDEDVTCQASAMYVVCISSGLFCGNAVCGGFLVGVVGFYNSILVMCCLTLTAGAISGIYFWRMSSFSRKRESQRNEEKEKTASRMPLLEK